MIFGTGVSSGLDWGATGVELDVLVTTISFISSWHGCVVPSTKRATSSLALSRALSGNLVDIQPKRLRVTQSVSSAVCRFRRMAWSRTILGRVRLWPTEANTASRRQRIAQSRFHSILLGLRLTNYSCSPLQTRFQSERRDDCPANGSECCRIGTLHGRHHQLEI